MVEISESGKGWDNMIKSVTLSSSLSSKSSLFHLLGPCFHHYNSVAGNVIKEQVSEANDHSVSYPTVREQLPTFDPT